MTARLLVVRHAEQVRQAGDPGLSDLGRQQAEAAAAAVSPARPVAVVASPLTRAQQTAGVIALRSGLQAVSDPRLLERMNFDAGIDAAAFASWWARSAAERDWQPPVGRSSRRTGDDLLAALSAAAVEGETVVVVTHGGATTDLLRTVLGDEELRRRAPSAMHPGPPHAAITGVRIEDGRWSVEDIASVDHLGDLG